MNWIKTSERLPESENTVFIVTSDKDYLTACFHADSNDAYWAGEDFEFDLEDVICWMGIPPLPEEQV